MATLTNLSPREAYAAYVMGSVLVDVREPADSHGKTPDVNKLIVLPYSQLNLRFEEIPTDKKVVVVSQVGNRSKEAAKFLIQQGYTQVATVDGGLAAWEDEGLPVR